ncbi:CheR family methyltransferase [Desulfobacterales bacterium HSG2]|nr:CheR family methyltransferase [Desulfobacterales bacterium HSG2]
MLEEKIGLSAEAVGSETIAKAIRYRMRRRGLLAGGGDRSFSAYLALLRTSEEEMEKLIEEVVVPETWFFRNDASFSFLGGYVRFEWLPEHKDRVLRILSVPCSTGEEPYSIGMTLMDMELPEEISRGRFHIDAVDIREKSLHKARLGIYGPESFRGEDLSFRERYFERVSGVTADKNGKETKNDFKVHGHLRNMVRFMGGNLLDNRILADEKPYDIIFCRNLMIYLSDLAKKKAMKSIDRLLEQNGILFVGHVERPLVCSSAKEIRFAWIRQAGVFACRKAGFNRSTQTGDQDKLSQKSVQRLPIKVPETHQERVGRGHKAEIIWRDSHRQHRPQRQPVSFSDSALFPNVGTPKPSSAPVPDSFPGAGSLTSFPGTGLGTLLDTAQRLADQGALNEATEVCEKHLNKNPFNVQTHFLMGLIWNARGDEDRAEEYFNKTVYLDPNHYEALSHLAFIMENRGDYDKAVHLRQRAQRILQKEGG